MKICIAYDGSPCAQDALDDLTRAGLPSIAEARIVAIADVFLPPPTPPGPLLPADIPPPVQQSWMQAEQAVENARGLAQRAQNQVQTLFPCWQVDAMASADSPAWGIIKQVDDWHPDLLLVGSHNRSTLGRLMLGSVSQTVVAEARCSVRVARRPLKASSEPVQILIGVDGSTDALAAVQSIAARSWPVGSTVRLVTLLDTRMRTALAPAQPQVGPWLGSSDTAPHDWVQRMLVTFQQPLEAAGLTVSTLIKEGDPKNVLPAEAEQWGADCLVVGARGLSRIERFVIGSVSIAVAARAHCSVEVVRPPRVG
ncbi:MAG: universal stress protein [Candidatus Tectimicrobiota bacterium]